MRVIRGGDEAFNALAYGECHRGTIEFLERSIAAPTRVIGEYAERFVNKANELYERLSGAAARQRAKAIRRLSDAVVDPNAVTALITPDRIRNASLRMQRIVMATPSLRKLYHAQRCDGYSGSYVDMFPNDIGRDHVEWRRIHDSMITVGGEEDDFEFKTTYYFDDVDIGDEEPLTTSEKVDAIDTMDAVDHYVRYGTVDVSNVFGGDL